MRSGENTELNRARRLSQEDAVIRLTSQDWDQLADFIESEDDDPNQALRRAAERNSDVGPAAAQRST